MTQPDFRALARQLIEAAMASREAEEGEPAAHPLAPYLIQWGEFWQAETNDEQWLLEPLFAVGRAHALFAGAKVGKSYVTLAACAALATGRPFLEHPGGEPADILYVDAEMTADDLRDRLTEFGYGPQDDLSHLHYALLPTLPGLDTPEGGTALLEAALAVSARLVIIDTTSRLLAFVNGKDENNAKPFQDFYRHSGMLLKQHGIAWARLDHAGKDADKGQRGSSAKNDDVDVVWKLARREGGVTMTATHRRMSWVPEKVEVDITTDSGLTSFKLAGNHAYPMGTKECADALDRYEAPSKIGNRHAQTLLRSKGEHFGNDVIAAAIRWRREGTDRVLRNAFDLREGEYQIALPNRPAYVGKSVDNPGRRSGTRSGTNGGLPVGERGAEQGKTPGGTGCGTPGTPVEPSLGTFPLRSSGTLPRANQETEDDWVDF